MKRHYCTKCKSKKNSDKLFKVYYNLLNKTAFHCDKCMSANADILSIRPVDRKPVFLELFSGSGHVSEIARSAGYESFTVDSNPKLNPDLALDIIKVRRNMLPGSVDVVWCSPPCTNFSNLNVHNHFEKINLGYRNYYYIPKTPSALQSLRIINKMFKVINWLRPSYYFIENPRGALRHLSYIKSIPFRKTVSYNDYGFDYFKPTDIFTNCPFFKPIPCRYVDDYDTGTTVVDLKGNYERSLIPPDLIRYMFSVLPFSKNIGGVTT